jgi:hypothetical protein
MVPAYASPRCVGTGVSDVDADADHAVASERAGAQAELAEDLVARGGIAEAKGLDEPELRVAARDGGVRGDDLHGGDGWERIADERDVGLGVRASGGEQEERTRERKEGTPRGGDHGIGTSSAGVGVGVGVDVGVDGGGGGGGGDGDVGGCVVIARPTMETIMTSSLEP